MQDPSDIDRNRDILVKLGQNLRSTAQFITYHQTKTNHSSSFMDVQVLILPNGPGTGISFWEILMRKFGAGNLAPV